MGGISSLWNATESDPSEIRIIGEIDKGGAVLFKISDFLGFNLIEEDSYTRFDRGSYSGFTGGYILSRDIEGLVNAIYVDPEGKAGFLIGRFNGEIFPDINMWEAEGDVYPVKIFDEAGFQTFEIYYLENGDINFESDISLLSYKPKVLKVSENPEIGLWQDMLGGTYSSVSEDWKAYLSFEHEIYSSEMIYEGRRWSDEKIEADVAGSWISWTDAVTGVKGGRLIGTFDPNTYIWQAISQGVEIETSRFLQMVEDSETEKLKNLNIPCVEIGRVDLSGGDESLSVLIKDVIFFSYSDGTPPKIWASGPTRGNPYGGVYGSYSDDPSGKTVSLSGSSDSCNFSGVSFTIEKWDTSSNRWGAKIDGSGTVKEFFVQIKGAAAGSINTDQKEFSGTASGIAISGSYPVSP